MVEECTRTDTDVATGRGHGAEPLPAEHCAKSRSGGRVRSDGSRVRWLPLGRPQLTPGERMRSLAIAICALLSTAAGAQDRDVRIERSGLPRDVVREATRLFNESSAMRSTGRVEIDEHRTV